MDRTQWTDRTPESTDDEDGKSKERMPYIPYESSGEHAAFNHLLVIATGQARVYYQQEYGSCEGMDSSLVTGPPQDATDNSAIQIIGRWIFI